MMHFDSWVLFYSQAQAFASDISGHFVAHPWSDFAAIAWLFVSICAGVACFYRSIRDTVPERIALAAISIGALSRAFFVFGRGEIPSDGVWTAVSLAFYCGVIWWKHVRVIPNRPDYKPPEDLPKY